VCLRATGVPEMSERPVGTTCSRASIERRSIDPIVGVVGLILIARNGMADPLEQDMFPPDQRTSYEASASIFRSRDSRPDRWNREVDQTRKTSGGASR
jgi:hypothetical protein